MVRKKKKKKKKKFSYKWWYDNKCACHRRGMSANMYGTAAKCQLATSRAAHVCPTTPTNHWQTTLCKHPTPILQMKKEGNPQPEKRGRRRVNVRTPSPLTPS